MEVLCIPCLCQVVIILKHKNMILNNAALEHLMHSASCLSDGLDLTDDCSFKYG